ncbi:hypothetical protein [Actinophytocola oryzae]|uniref:Uncharacterized protein n=1 Tax=Actinophytocola oryzae TaxID=502181 RepID=A0A4R7VV42_9PSEU|nr:hypothetical protein [Actinophytocola oryzae]TDV53873.1 hypothetical protein CLV71_104341 [Actinophytocola oryzae]
MQDRSPAAAALLSVMDEVVRHARALVDDDEVVRLRGIAGLAAHPHDDTAITELIESVKNDLFGELSIVAAVALAEMNRANPAVATAVAARFRDTVGSIALYGGYDPTLRLTYFFAVAGIRDWFHGMRPGDVRARTDEYRANVLRYVAAGSDGDVATAARLMVWFESLDTAGQRLVFRTARRLLPGWDHWFKPLARATHR